LEGQLKTILLAALAAALSPTMATAAPATQTASTAVRIDKARVDRALLQMVSGGRAAGASALVWRDGKEVYFGTAGYADREETAALLAQNGHGFGIHENRTRGPLEISEPTFLGFHRKAAWNEERSGTVAREKPRKNIRFSTAGNEHATARLGRKFCRCDFANHASHRCLARGAAGHRFDLGGDAVDDRVGEGAVALDPCGQGVVRASCGG
jgi:hypothetical protein